MCNHAALQGIAEVRPCYEEAEACGSHAGFVETVKVLQNRMHAEIDLEIFGAGGRNCCDEEGELPISKYTMWDGL